MASVSKDSKGWRIRYYSSEGKQKSIRPGKVNKATAERIGRHVDALAVQIVSRGTLERQTAIWLGEIGDKLHAKLVNAGLTEPRVQVSEEADDAEQQLLLLDFMQDHIDNGRTAKGGKAARSTLNKWRATQTLLNTVFQIKPISHITPEDAHQFRVWLDNRRIKQKTAGRKGLPMAENAKRTHIATCKTFFNAA